MVIRRNLQSGISILKVPFDLGAGCRGSQLAPDAILRAGLKERIHQLGLNCVVESEVTLDPSKANHGAAKDALNHLAEVVQINTKLADEVEAAVVQGNYPIILGGDHSIAIGTLSGLSRMYQNLGVIWFDAHADLNTEATSPSGNIHGMSLAVGLGRGHPLLTQIKSTGFRIKPEHVVIIGARSLDEGEKHYIRDSGVICFTMHDIDRLGIAVVIKKSIERLAQTTDGIHLSFDIDSLDPHVAPGTGTPVKGGVSYREAHFALELLYESGLITSVECVEVNPQLDAHNMTAELAVELLATVLGEKII